MARIDIDKITKIDKSIRRHDFVRATYSVAQVDEDSSVFQIDTYSGPEDGHITQTLQFDTNNLSKLLKLISSNFESFSIPLLDDKGNIKYGLNWGNRNGRNINQAYLDLPVEIYQSDFFPTNGTKFVIRTDDNVNIIFTRAQKDNVYGHALQTPDDNTIIGKYIRKRLSLKPGEIITKEAIEKYGRNFITISKIGDFYYLDFSSSRKDRRVQINQCLPLQLTDLLSSPYRQYLTAIRTKPFLLLAGISGTGKSRIVRELAFKSCPKYLQDKDGTTPGNYCMIEVKPNWHDSTELLGYYSNLSKSYQFKKFVKFLVKAKMFPDVPFFVCLDEMNLAPVEQYFAEILSILETRKVVTDEYGNRNIKTGTIIDAEHFKALGKIGDFTQNFTDRDIYMKLHDIATESDIAEEVGNRTDLTTEGLTLPDNVIIIGTVNMDDTTHQFSRKVIDRAMTIEMNGGKLKKMFGGSNNLAYLEEEEQQKWQAAFKQRYVSADEVLEAHPDKAEEIIKLLPEKLEAINVALKGTPFEVSYRVLNELTIMVGVMLDAESEAEFETIVNKALDRILLMKILPRIEGDSDMFNLKAPQKVGDVTCHNRLEWLRELAPSITATEEEGKEHQQTAKEKIEEMIERLNNQEFTRFWP